jgi:hypothetical protein
MSDGFLDYPLSGTKGKKTYGNCGTSSSEPAIIVSLKRSRGKRRGEKITQMKQNLYIYIYIILKNHRKEF